MAPLSLTTRYPERYRVTTDSRHDNRIAPGLPAREFTVSAPGKVRTTEITYIRTYQGGQYPATVTDLYSRRIAGRAMAGHTRTALCTEALQRAYWRRKPGRGLIHHSDRGSQYTGDDYRKRLAAMGMKVSHSGRGQCRDNAPRERFFRSLKDESPEYETLRTGNDARPAVPDYLAYYNSRRPHSILDYLSPMEYEQRSLIKVA